MGELKMPSLGADMEAGTLVEWKIKPGDVVKRGDVVATVETDKGLIEIEIWEDGRVERLVVAPKTKVPVGTVLATLVTPAAQPSTPLPLPKAPPAPLPSAPPPLPPPPTPRPPSRVLASPAAKQLARERGIDLTRVKGTGPHGVVTRDDVDHAEAPAPAPAGLDLPKIRRAIAAAMARSKREIPHYYLATDIDASAALAWIARENEKRPVEDRLLLAALLIRATARAIREVPEMNGFFENDEFRPSRAVHAGVAISLRGGGLVSPAIHDAESKSVAEINAGLRDLVARARLGRLRASEMSDPTITITSLGDQGVETVYGIIYPPQVAIVGFGKPTERPWAQNGMLGVRPVLTATLSCMGLAARSLRILQEPEEP